jgi:hypothetical protein
VVSAQPSALERALGELYAASPEEFVLVRTRLAGELRDAGDMAAATEVRGRRRPNLAAWACNQLARQHADEVGELLEATRRVAAAQGSAARGGEGDALRREGRARQELVAHLADQGVALLRGRAPKPEAYRDSITATLDAASLDAALAEELRAGRLTRVLSSPAGFEASLDLGDAGRSRPGIAAGAAQAARRALADARQAAQGAEAAARTADSEAASADLRSDAAQAHLQEVERALERARASADEAGKQARLARARADAGRAEAEAAERRLQDLERRTSGPGRSRRRRRS